jgi:hypothetical protein
MIIDDETTISASAPLEPPPAPAPARAPVVEVVEVPPGPETRRPSLPAPLAPRRVLAIAVAAALAGGAIAGFLAHWSLSSPADAAAPAPTCAPSR